ncbi:hypothetical protein ACSESK_22415, partial [Pseudomonas aeruginosa]
VLISGIHVSPTQHDLVYLIAGLITDMFMSYSNRLFPPSTEFREVHVHINFKNRSVLHFH